MATFTSVTRQNILQAIAEYDSRGADDFLGVYGYVASVGYELVHEGRSYDPKAILGVAHRYATGFLVPSHEFSGGDQGRGGGVAQTRVRGGRTPTAGALCRSRCHCCDAAGDPRATNAAQEGSVVEAEDPCRGAGASGQDLPDVFDGAAEYGDLRLLRIGPADLRSARRAGSVHAARAATSAVRTDGARYGWTPCANRSPIARRVERWLQTVRGRHAAQVLRASRTLQCARRTHKVRGVVGDADDRFLSEVARTLCAWRHHWRKSKRELRRSRPSMRTTALC